MPTDAISSFFKEEFIILPRVGKDGVARPLLNWCSSEGYELELCGMKEPHAHDLDDKGDQIEKDRAVVPIFVTTTSLIGMAGWVLV